MIRDDVSDRLIHLTRGSAEDPKKNREEAIENLKSILFEGALNGGNGFIKGKFNCVCFSEAPVSKLPYILANARVHKFKYSPYGVMVEKRWFYEQGGRPVIYGPAEDYEMLPDVLKYRYVQLRLGKPYDIDFSWEREWRAKTDKLALDPARTTIVLPDRSARDVFADTLKDKWHYLVLSDLGVPIEALLA